MQNFLKFGLLLIIAVTFSSNAFSQSEKTYNSGTIYWGTFDMENQDIVGDMKKYADIIQLKRIDYDYFVYAKDSKGNFRVKYSKINNEPNVENKYVDEDGVEYLINEKNDTIYILCLKPLPNMSNKYMILKITDVF